MCLRVSWLKPPCAIQGPDLFRDGISEIWAAELLERAVYFAEAAVQQMLVVPLTDGKLDALQI